jgi:hypothetical protein
MLIMAWGAVSVVLVLLLILRSVISMKEDDQLFLDPAEAGLEADQKEVMNQLHHLDPYVKGFAYGSGVLLLAIIGIVGYRVFQALMGG